MRLFAELVVWSSAWKSLILKRLTGKPLLPEP
jgi:hypothetical protein